MARVPKMARRNFFFPSHAAFTAVPSFYFLCSTRVSILWRTCVYVHTSDCVEILLPNNTASGTLFHISRALWNIDRIFIIWALAWLGKYVTVDRKFYNLLLKQEVAAAPVSTTLCSLLHSSMRLY